MRTAPKLDSPTRPDITAPSQPETQQQQSSDLERPEISTDEVSQPETQQQQPSDLEKPEVSTDEVSDPEIEEDIVIINIPSNKDVDERSTTNDEDEGVLDDESSEGQSSYVLGPNDTPVIQDTDD